MRRLNYFLAGLACAMAILFAGATDVAAQFSATFDLHKAVKDGDYYAARNAIVKGANVNARDDYGVPLIYVAAESGNAGMVYLLVDAGANPDLTDRKTSTTALMTAAQRNNSDMAKMLIQRKANLDKEDKSGETALIKASRLGHEDIVRMLIDAGADLDHQDYTGRSALRYAEDGRKRRVVDLLRQAGASD